MNGAMLLRVFVYGSLKRGCENYAAYCADRVAATEAAVVGRLYLQTSGYPMLLVPPHHVLHVGTSDWAADARIDQSQAAAADAWCQAAPDGDWQPIRGDLFTFDDPETRLARLDELEEFCPGGVSLYHRVIVPIICQGPGDEGRVEAAWTYVAPSGMLPDGCRRMPPGP